MTLPVCLCIKNATLLVTAVIIKLVKPAVALLNKEKLLHLTWDFRCTVYHCEKHGKATALRVNEPKRTGARSARGRGAVKSCYFLYS